MLYSAYSGTNTREELIKLINGASTKPTSYHILNCIMNANESHQYTFCTQLTSCVIVRLPEFMLDTCALKRYMIIA